MKAHPITRRTLHARALLLGGTLLALPHAAHARGGELRWNFARQEVEEVDTTPPPSGDTTPPPLRPAQVTRSAPAVTADDMPTSDVPPLAPLPDDYETGSEASKSGLATSASSCTAEVGSAVGKVLRVKDGIVYLRIDPKSLLVQGDHVAFHDAIGDERVVGTVDRVNNKTYQIRIQMNEEVRVGETGYRSPSDPTGYLIAPQLSDYVAAFGVTVRPWLGLSGKESGVLVDAFASYRLSERLRLRVAVEPASPNIGNTPGTLEAFAAPSVTFRLAELGFGIGAGTANQHGPNPPGIGVLLTPILRVGAEDGIAVRIRSSAVIHHQQAVFGSLRGDAEIPVAYGTRILVSGGAGDSGYLFAESGLKMLMIGEGRGGSWFAHAVLGYGGTFSTYWGPDTVERTSALGPYMGLGVEWRL